MSDKLTPANENISPEKLNSPRRKRITKAGPPSKEELEERRKMLEEYKRSREEKRKGIFGFEKQVVQKVEEPSEQTEQMGQSSTVLPLENCSQNEDDVAESTDNSTVMAENLETNMDLTIKTEQDLSFETNDAETKPDETAAHIDQHFHVKESSCAFENAEQHVEELSVSLEDNEKEIISTENTEEMVCTLVLDVESAEYAPSASNSSEIPKWKSNDAFWLLNDVFIQYECLETQTVVLERVPKPHLRLFRLSQVEKQLACGNRELAGAMLSVMQAPGQLPSNDVSRSKKFKALLERIKTGSSMESLEVPPLLETSIELPEPPKPGHFSGSDSDQDETGSRLALDVEEATRRHSLILSDCVTPKRQVQSVQRAARMILEDGMIESVKRRLDFDGPATEGRCSKTRRVDIDLTGADDDEHGSTVKYAMLTPSKRIQSMLQTDMVVSPVRRSSRNLDSNNSHGMILDSLDQIEDSTQIGYLPNNSLPSNNSLTGTPKKNPTKRAD